MLECATRPQEFAAGCHDGPYPTSGPFWQLGFNAIRRRDWRQLRSMMSVRLTRVIAFRPCRGRRKSYPFNRLLGPLARPLARRHFPVVAHRLPCKFRWLAAWNRRFCRVVPIQAEPVEKPVDRAIDRLFRCTDFVVARIAAKPLDGLKVYCVWKSLPLLFLLKKFLKPPQLPNEERLPAAGPRRCRRDDIPAYAREQRSKSWRGTCNQARSSTSLFRNGSATKGRLRDTSEDLFARSERD